MALLWLESFVKNKEPMTLIPKQLIRLMYEALKEQDGLVKALAQATATNEYLNAEKENVIKEIEERKAFNLKCDGQPEWLRKGIDVGLNTALDILKGKDGDKE